VQKNMATTKSNDQICVLSPGVYLDVNTISPQRVVIKEKELVTIVENRDDTFVVAMIDSQTMILVHRDCIEKT